MGYRKVPVIHSLTFDQYEGLVVRMKGLKIGKMRRLIRLLDNDDSSTGDVVDEMFKLVCEGLISWTLEDENGSPLPAVQDQVEELDFAMLSAILSEWLDKLTGVDEDLGKDSINGVKFPGQPLTMELL